MRNLLDFFSLHYALHLLLLIGLLEFVGGRMGRSYALLWWARGFAAAGFLSYAACGIGEWEPKRPDEFLTLGLRAALAMGLTHGVASVVLPAIGFLHRHFVAIPAERHRAWVAERNRRETLRREERERAERERREQEQQAEAARRRQEEIARRPPPPTREELLTAARTRYENALRLLATANLEPAELQAGQLRAKQQFLREIDGLMK
jgi:hypothetical protein